MPNELNIIANRRSFFFYRIIMLLFCHTIRTEFHLVKVRLPFDSMAMLILAIKFVWRQLGVSHFSVR